MPGIYSCCLFMSIGVLFQKIVFVSLIESRHYLKSDEVSKLSSNMQYHSVANETNDKQNQYQMFKGKFKRNEGGMKKSDISNELSITLPVYKFRGNEKSCIILAVDAILSVKYLPPHRDPEVRDTYVPGRAKVKGNCSDENEQSISVSWKTFVLTWTFVKVPDKGKWFLSKIELKYDPSDLFYDFINFEGETYILSSSTSNSEPVISAPIGKSYTCDRDIAVNLSSPQIRTIATLIMMKADVKPFSDNNYFGNPHISCPAVSSSCRYCTEILTLTVTVLAAIIINGFFNLSS